MFFKKSKKNKDEKLYNEPFKIPQIPKDIYGLKTKSDQRTKNRFVSSFFGNNVKDEIVIPKYGRLEGDLNKRYEPFRVNSRISDEELKEKYGTKYPEFKLLKNSLREEIFNKNKDKEKGINNTLNNNYNNMNTIKNENDINPNSNINIEYNFNDDKEVVEKIDINDINNKNPNLNIDFNSNTNPNSDSNFNKNSNSFIVEENDIKLKSQSNLKKSYQLPKIDFLKRNKNNYSLEEPWNKEQIKIIDDILNQFNIEGKVISFSKGPTVTRYEIRLEPGVKVNKITSIEDNLKMSLAVESINIQAPIPGKPNVGIEVPNKEREIVLLGDICSSDEFLYSDKKLLAAIGIDTDRNNIFLDIEEMPHGLIAGMTGSGKSVAINTILVSLLLRNTPEDLRLMLIDPKKVELAIYNDLPHLVTPVISETKVASKGLKWAVNEMEKRYMLFSDNRVRDIKSYNQENPQEKLPYIVIVIDELADLMIEASQDVEASIQRLTQKARAAGIHLLVATQRPTTDVIKGTIKANIPTRLSFKVAQHIDSQTILDRTGGETLLGKGDLFIKQNDILKRCQAAYVSDEEISNIVNYIKTQSSTNFLLSHEKLTEIPLDYDDLLYDVARYVVDKNYVSINRIQKDFNIGFSRAQDIVEQLAKLNIINNVVEGGRGREVLVTLNQLEDIIRRNINGN